MELAGLKVYDLDADCGTLTIRQGKGRKDWILTTVWAISMDAVAIGVIVLVLSGIYLWWNRRDKRIPGLVAFALDAAVCALYLVGLRRIFG